MYNAYVVKIQDLKKHPNADKLQVAKVFGLSVIVGNDVQLGDVMIYFPSDGQLNKEFAEYCNLLRKKDEHGNNIGGYMDERKCNIKAIKLRGEYSDGLLIPVHKLTEFLKLDKDYFEVGSVVNTAEGVEICKKYVPQRNNKTEYTSQTTKKNKKDKYPLFHEHKDTMQLVYNESSIVPGDKITVSLKLHGTSGRTSYTKVAKEKDSSFIGKIKRLLFKNKDNNEYEYVSGTRRTIVNDDNPGYYGENGFRKEHHNKFVDKLHKGETVYYEIVGYTESGQLIMPQCDNKKLNDKEFVKRYGETTSFTYGCKPKESEIYVYRITMTNDDGVEFNYSTDQMILRCEQLGVKHVPILCEITITEDNRDAVLENVKMIAIGRDTIDASHIREGIVVRVENRLDFTAYKHKSMDFKILEGIIKENAVEPDLEEEQSE